MTERPNEDNEMRVTETKTVLSTPWFDLVAKTTNDGDPEAPYYSIETSDYVSVLALTEEGQVLLVRQYRPAVEARTLELPSGHVDKGETPEEAARRELLEETGYQADRVEILGCTASDTGRLGNRTWHCFASGAVPCEPPQPAEPGIEAVRCSQADLMKYVAESKLDNGLNLGAVLLGAIKRGLFGLLPPAERGARE